MHKTKLLELLRSLDKDEFRRFYKFVKSPWYNSNKGVVQLYEYLRPFYPDFDSPKLKKELVFKKLFAGERYRDTRIRTLISLLKRLVEDYLVERELQLQPFRKKEILTEAMSKRNLYDFFSQQSHEMIEMLEAQSTRDMHYYHAKMLRHQELFFHPKTAKYSLESEHLKATVHNLDQFYLLAKLRFSLEMAGRRKMLAEDHDNFMIEEILTKMNDLALASENPVIGLYTDILKLHEYGRNDAILDRVKGNLRQHTHLLTLDQNEVVLTNLINHTIQVYNTGVQHYLEHQLELYQFGLERGLVTRENQISEASFTNIVVIGSILKQFEWVRGFIKTYASFLDPKIKTQAQNLGEAYLYYHQGDYETTISKLMTVPFLEVTYGFRARGLLLRTYFECTLQDDNYYDLMLSHLRSFQKYLKRNPTIGKEREKAYANLINLTHKLAIILFEKFREHKLLKQLKEEVEATSPVITKAWLLEKIEDCGKKTSCPKT